jgi:hypothetical protein
MLEKRVLIIILAAILIVGSQTLVLASNSGVKDSQYSIPFQGMNLNYYSATTPILLQQTGLSANGWINLMFHDLTSSSSKLDISVNGNVTENGQESPASIQTSTVDFPTNQDTILFLRNGGQQSLQIYAGPVGQAFQLIPGSSVNLSGTWTLHDTYSLHTALGAFTAYRYHYSISGGNTALDFYASYEKVTQVLIYGEVYATQNGLSALIEKLELRNTNVQFTTTSTTSSSTPGSSSPSCVIATAAYGSALAPPVQFLREFRDQNVEKTYLGSQFMSAFNAWYYSWAPSIARLESTNAGLRAGMRGLILPLIATLIVSQELFTLIAPFNPEVAIFISGLAASGLVGLAYLTPILLLPFLRLMRGRTLTKKGMVCLVVFGVIVTLAGTVTHGSFGVVENLSALAVVEAILLTPVVCLSLVSHRIQKR